MAFVKSGVVTRIDIVGDEYSSNEFISKYFDLSLYDKSCGVYLLKSDVFNDNICSFREEYMSFSLGRCDSFDSCEAFCLDVPVLELFNSNISFIDDNTRYIFDGYDMVFDVDVVRFYFGSVRLDVYMIPVFFDVNYTESEDFNFVSMTVNNLTRKAMKNVLKGASWFSLI